MILGLASYKGGVGKTTVTAALATALALRGDSVLVVDCDPNQCLKAWSDDPTFELPAGLSVQEAALRDLPACVDRAIDSELYDHVLIDLMGAREASLLEAFGLVDLVIIPAQASRPDLHEAFRVAEDVRLVADKLRALGARQGIPYRLLLTKMSPLRTRVGQHTFALLANRNMPCFKTTMVERVVYREMFFSGELPTEGEKGIGACKEIEDLLLEIQVAIARSQHVHNSLQAVG